MNTNTTQETTDQTSELNGFEQMFVKAFNELAIINHSDMRKKGWWDDRDKLLEVATTHSPELGKFAETALRGLGIALKTSELSEALEGIRHGNPPDDKIPEFTAEEAEYADTIIRIMDTVGAHGLRVGEAVVAKIHMNRTRAHKHGGKTD